MAEDSNSILKEAQLINNDLGRHSVKCNFSTRLSGRFYQNCSLERYTMRRSRLSEMQSKRRRLERELVMEKRRVVLMRERLLEVENAREFALDMIFAIQRGVIEFQAAVRQRQARKLLQSMKHEVRMKQRVALFFQARFRGWKGRLRAASTREYARQQMRNKCTTAIQTVFRCYRQRKAYLDMLSKMRILRESSAVHIQAAFRGFRMQQLYRQEIKRRQETVVEIQRVFRGMNGRRMAERRRQEEIARLRAEAEEKPKRIPLHMRRYSTYGASANESTQLQQRGKVPPRHNSMLTRKRGSIDLVRTSPSAFISSNSSLDKRVDADENDSVASSITSLTSAYSLPQQMRPVEQSNPNNMGPRLARGRGVEIRRKLSCQPTPPRRASVTSSSSAKKRRSSYSEGIERRRSLRTYYTREDTTNSRSVSKKLDTGRKSSLRASASQSQCQIKDVVASINITDEACSIAEEVQVLCPISDIAAIFVKEVITESVISFNIHSALADDDALREDDDDFAF